MYLKSTKKLDSLITSLLSHVYTVFYIKSPIKQPNCWRPVEKEMIVFLLAITV